MTYGRVLVVGLTVGLLCLVAAPASSGHSTDQLGRGLSERELRQFETRMLGSAHAAEHALSRRLERRARVRWRKLSPAQRRAERARDERARRRLVARSAAAFAPETDGRWNGRIQIPVMGIHAVLLPTGKVLWWSRPDADDPVNTSIAYVWDPTKPAGDPAALKRVDPPVDPATGLPFNLYCAGHSLLRRRAAAGHRRQPRVCPRGVEDKGLNLVFTFDPWTETWTEQPRMAHGRWYPTQTPLPDGRTLITSGRNETGSAINAEIEVFNPPASRGGQGSIAKLGDYGSSLPGSPRAPYYYPHWFVMPNGNLLNAGMDWNESWVLRLNGNALSSSDRPTWQRQHRYGSGVLLPGGPQGSTRVAQIGGFGTSAGAVGDAHNVTEVFDEAQPTSAPTVGPNLVQARAHHNTVLLPDGSMIAIGGGYGRRNDDLRLSGPEHLLMEIWNPATNTWRLGPAQAYKRAYHSTALLLPDGRVVSAGDDRDPTKDPGRQTDVAELYEPAYLFAPGPRPTITDAPITTDWNQSFRIQTDTPITRAVLVAPSATTHSTDMQQRHVELRMTPTATGATVTSPPDANVAPPGHYMLFALSATGKPSIAKWIVVGGSGSAAAPPPSSTPQPGAKDRRAPRLLRLSVVSRKLKRALKRGLRVRIRTDESGTATVPLSVSRDTARKLALKRRAKGRMTVGRAKKAIPNGRSTVVVKFKAKPRKAIRKTRKLKLRIAVRLTDAAGNTARRATTVTLKR